MDDGLLWPREERKDSKLCQSSELKYPKVEEEGGGRGTKRWVSRSKRVPSTEVMWVFRGTVLG